MPRKNKAKEAQESKPVIPTTSTTAPKAKNRRGRKPPSTLPSESQPEQVDLPSVAEETQPEVSEAEAEVVAENPVQESKPRVVPTRDSVKQEFEDLTEFINQEIAKMNESKSKGTKILRSINKRLKTLQSHALRLSKQKSTVKRTNQNCGFNKPIKISEKLAQFTGWDANQLYTRNDVTTYLCNYIREHDLQNPSNRKFILVEKDPGLKEIFSHNSGKNKIPVTYASMQKLLKRHYPETKPKSKGKKSKTDSVVQAESVPVSVPENPQTSVKPPAKGGRKGKKVTA